MKRVSHLLPIVLLVACTGLPNVQSDNAADQQDLAATTLAQTTPAEEQPAHTAMAQSFSGEQCQAREEVRFNSAPADPDQLAYIYPLGYMFGSHVTPVDHQYYYWSDPAAPLEQYAIASPADGVVVSVSFLQSDYRVVIEHSCDLYSIYIHLETLAGPLAELDGQVSFQQAWSGRIPVLAGEVIAYDGGTAGLDYSLHDGRVVLQGLIEPDTYAPEPWKIHTVDPYDYFEETVRERLLAVNLRQVPPLGGKIDHDLPGTPMGNWFVEGTNGYQGVVSTEGPVAPQQSVGYWNTHLAIAPDAIDPDVLMALHGTVSNNGGPFAISAASPDPRKVTLDSGPVKLVLVSWFYQGSDGEHWFGQPAPMDAGIRVQRLEDQILGILLLQMLEADRLQAEFFIDHSSDEVQGFTEAAQIFER